MRKKGLVYFDFDQMYQELLKLDRASFSSKQALRSFLNKKDFPKGCYEVGIKEIYEKPIYPRSIRPHPHAIEVLHELALSHQLILVTKGKKQLQEEKMRLACIPKHLFSDIYFCGCDLPVRWGKKKIYVSIGKKFDVPPHSILVCGDRISSDLSPAKKLGYTTLHMKWGRGLGNTGLKKDADYTIECLREVALIARDIEIKS